MRHADGLELGAELPVRGGAFASVARSTQELEVPLLVGSALSDWVLVVDVHQVDAWLSAAVHTLAALRFMEFALQLW